MSDSGDILNSTKQTAKKICLGIYFLWQWSYQKIYCIRRIIVAGFFMSNDVSRNKEIEQEISMAFSAFFQFIFSSDKENSSEIKSNNNVLENEKN